jgi:hypothetical protein
MFKSFKLFTESERERAGSICKMGYKVELSFFDFYRIATIQNRKSKITELGCNAEKLDEPIIADI